jgi:predicted histone-like DNA-binding protein
LIPSDVSLFRHGAHPVSTEIHFFWGYTLQSLSAKRSRQQKSTGKGEKIQSFSKWAFVQFLFLLVSFPSDTGHAPSLRNTTFVQKCNFLGLPAHRKTFVDGTFKKNLPMNVPKHLLKHVPLPYLCSVKQKKTAMIKYIVRNKKNPKDKTKSAFYPVVVKTGYVELDRVAQDISDQCTVTEHDIKGVLSALEEHVIRELQNGHSVRLGDLGSYHLAVNSKKGGKTAAKDVTSEDVKKIRVHFIKSAHLAHAFNLANPDIQFQGPARKKTPKASV